MALLGGCGPVGAPGPAPPMPALDAPVRPYAEVYGVNDRLLATLAAQATARGETAMATLLDSLDQALQDGSLDIEAAADTAPRLSRYVYPVV